MSETELSVVCKNCGSEVSPYVTECPYCGARLRKRAPKLERRGDTLEPRPRKRPRRRLRVAGRIEAFGATRVYATSLAIAASVATLLVQRALDLPLADLGAVVGPVGGEWWRYLAAPFAYADIGYLFVIGLMLAIFGPGLERRLGSLATALLLLACGGLGMVAAAGIDTAIGDFPLAAGGNGVALGAVAAWFAIRHHETRDAIDEDYDRIGVAVAAAVLLALPLFEDTANVFAGLAGGGVGAMAGLAAASLGSGE
ncbi:MAG: rhomboid family intramembrane serine protease [Solirubrobacterales bacterium]